MAKDMCEKLKRKRSSLVGAFVSTHGRSIDDVDRSILEAKTALLEVTQDLTERSQRWRQIEMLCGCTIMNNPGIAILQNLVRHVGAGRHTATATTAGSTAGTVAPSVAGGSTSRPGLSSRMSSSVSQDDLMFDDDTHSVAASSSHLTSVSSHLSRPTVSVLGMSTTDRSSSANKSRRSKGKTMSRESSKESSSSDELQGMVLTHLGRRTGSDTFIFLLLL